MTYEATDVPRWISVEERLPNDAQVVLVWPSIFGVQPGYYDGHGWWNLSGSRFKRTTHWRPLPGPPKEE